MSDSILNIDKRTIIVISIMSIMVVFGLAFAWFYYSNINEAEDPRVLQAKTIYSRYDALAEAKRYEDILLLLDSMESIYGQYRDYKDSYEIGVVYNNKAALYLTMGLFETDDKQKKDSLLVLAKKEVLLSIQVYEQWMKEFGALNETQIGCIMLPVYQENNKLFIKNKQEHYINKRTKDILLAQKETPRRLSVAYTNLGIILRHQGQVEEALKTYEKALKLWEQNLTAENNINIILGRPIRERSILEKVFPEKK